MKKLLQLAIAGLVSGSLSAQYSDPNVPMPSSGYGSNGTYTVAMETFNNANFNGHDIVIFHPQEITTPVPTIFYSHAYGGNNPNYISGLTDFVAKKGYAFVFVPYQTTGVTVPERYTNLLQGFRKAARDYPNIIDTTRTGFMGHSFGGGASFGNSYTCFTENNWGSNGKFIYASAEWYSYNITQNQLQNFPANTKLVTEIYLSDSINDHRMAMDVFTNISIPESEKDFLILQRDTVGGYVYNADHNTPNTMIAFDAHDYYGIYRILDALADYTWNGTQAAKNVCLGNGSAEQTTMPGALKPMLQTDNPTTIRPMESFEFPCDTTINQRIAYCNNFNAGIDEETRLFTIYPNPFSGSFNLESTSPIVLLGLTDIAGKMILFESHSTGNTLEIILTNAEPGIYFLQTNIGTQRIIQQ